MVNNDRIAAQFAPPLTSCGVSNQNGPRGVEFMLRHLQTRWFADRKPISFSPWAISSRKIRWNPPATFWVTPATNTHDRPRKTVLFACSETLFNTWNNAPVDTTRYSATRVGFYYYLYRKSYVFVGVCRFVCYQDYAKTTAQAIITKFGGKAAHEPRKKRLDFGGSEWVNRV